MQEQWQQLALINTDASDVKRIDSIQSLWSGYGEIFRVELIPQSLGTRIIKHVNPQLADNHPRGWNTDKSAQRKLRSYDVEAYWYQHWSSGCTQNCRVPECFASRKIDNQSWLVLEDLDASGFNRRHSHLKGEQAKTVLRWLANFHATFLGQTPEGLWPIGTYWHLDTRPDELNNMEESALKDLAGRLDDLLNNCEFKTFVHGDAKLANFCFNDNNSEVAAVDFQYIGGGCGMKDVAYFFGSCFDDNECKQWIPSLLDFYFETFINAVKDRTIDIEKLEREWRAMFAPAWTDFHRFLLGWMPGHKKINNYTRKLTEQTLREL